MSENYFYSSLSGQEIEDTLLGSVRGDVAQTRSNLWKAQARQNIGAGAEATGFQILGYYNTLQDLIDSLQVLPQPGDAYGIGTQPPYEIYVYDGATDSWLDNGTLNVDVIIDDADVSEVKTWSSDKINTAKQDKITAVGMLKGSGSAVSAAMLGTDYTAVDDADSSSSAKTWSISKIINYIASAISGLVSYATAQTLTTAQKAQARSNIGASSKWELLWTNENPSSSFSAQVLPISHDYDAYAISVTDEGAYAGTFIFLMDELLNTTGSAFYSYSRCWSGGGAIFTRFIAYNANGLFIDAGRQTTLPSSYNSAANTRAVPWKIYGIHL